MRKEGWQRALNEFLNEWQERYRDEGFVWGRTDCVHFAADWVLMLTGEDPLGELRGAYASREDAAAILDASSLAQMLRDRFEEVPLALAQRGDLAYMKVGDMECCGVMFTSGARMMALFLGEGGFTMHRARDVHLAFAVR